MTTLQEQTDIRFVSLDVTTMTLIAVPDEDCTPDGDTWVFAPRSDPPRIYVAGPMTGYEQWNFPAFDAARDELLALGFQVISPADLDRARGVNEDTRPEDFTPDAFATSMRIDMYANLQCTHIFMLRGWEASTGAKQENAWANAIANEVLFQEGAFVGKSELTAVAV